MHRSRTFFTAIPALLSLATMPCLAASGPVDADSKQVSPSVILKPSGSDVVGMPWVVLTPTEAALTPSQLQRADDIKKILARKFRLQPGDFNVVLVEGKPMVMMTAKTGIFMGKWEKIFDPFMDESEFVVMIDGKPVDTRRGMTMTAYKALMADAVTRGVHPMPDSPEMSGGTNEFMRSTLITGENDGWSRYAVYRGEPIFYPSRPFTIENSRRFRPAVILPIDTESHAEAVRAAIAEKFLVDPKDVGTVSFTDDQQQSRIVVMLKSDNGIPVGEWQQIFSPANADKFLINTGDHLYDTRNGMTKAVYRAFLDEHQAQRGNQPMPDSLEQAGGVPEKRAATWLTGEHSDHLSRYASWSYGGRLSVVSLNPEMMAEGGMFRFRPTAWLDPQ